MDKTKYATGQRVVCNGNPEAVILRVIGPRQYEVRLWQGNHHVGDVVTCDKDLDIDNPQNDAYEWATREQGYTGTYAEWLALSADERQVYEDGAAGIGTE